MPLRWSRFWTDALLSLALIAAILYAVLRWQRGATGLLTVAIVAAIVIFGVTRRLWLRYWLCALFALRVHISAEIYMGPQSPLQRSWLAFDNGGMADPGIVDKVAGQSLQPGKIEVRKHALEIAFLSIVMGWVTPALLLYVGAKGWKRDRDPHVTLPAPLAGTETE